MEHLLMVSKRTLSSPVHVKTPASRAHKGTVFTLVCTDYKWENLFIVRHIRADLTGGLVGHVIQSIIKS